MTMVSATTAMYTIIACAVCVMFGLIEAGCLTNSGLFSHVSDAISVAEFSALLKYCASSHLYVTYDVMPCHATVAGIAVAALLSFATCVCLRAPKLMEVQRCCVLRIA